MAAPALPKVSISLHPGLPSAKVSSRPPGWPRLSL